MTLQKNILTILILLLLSCNGKKKKLESELQSEPIIESETKTESELDKDYSKSAELFVQEVLRENMRIHSFDFSDSEYPKHLRIFQSNGIEKITAYSNKNYPKKSKPRGYEHFNLFVATYKDSETAKNSFGQMKSDSKYGFTDLRNLNGELAERVELLSIGAKPGGMIIQKEKHIFSLVETCRETPIGGNWIDYENKFIEYTTEKGEEIEVLNADCGMDRYRLERRKASSQQSLL